MSKIGINLSSDNSVKDVLARVKTDHDVFQGFCPQSNNLVGGHGARMLYEKLGVEDIEQIIGYKFKEKSFLLQAFTHARSVSIIRLDLRLRYLVTETTG